VKIKSVCWKLWIYSFDFKSRCWHFWQGLFLCPSQGWYARLCDNGCYPSSSDSFGGSRLRVFEPRFSLVGWAFWCRPDVWSGSTKSWFMSSRPVPSAHRASCNCAFWSLTFQLTTRFSKVVKYALLEGKEHIFSFPFYPFSFMLGSNVDKVVSRWKQFSELNNNTEKSGPNDYIEASSLPKLFEEKERKCYLL
jgi:hypothetical protein